MPGPGDSVDEEFEKNGFDFTKDESLEDERFARLRADNVKLQEQLEAAVKSKESMVMRYAMGEKEVMRLSKEAENSDKKIKMLMKEMETLNQQNKQLSAERNHFAQLADQKNQAIEEDAKSMKARIEELQKELKSVEITKSQFVNDFAKEKAALQQQLADIISQNETAASEMSLLREEIGDWKMKAEAAEEVQAFKKDCEKLKEELASKEYLIKWTQDRVAALETECEQIKQNSFDAQHDVTNWRTKEVELLAYTQQVTENNVNLQAKLSEAENRVIELLEENKNLSSVIKEASSEKIDVESTLVHEKEALEKEKDALKQTVDEQILLISSLQQQVDEMKGELVLLKKKHDSALKELSKELRRHAKEVNEGMSHSSRTSSSSSLNNIDNHKPKSPDTHSLPEKTTEVDYAPLPDQQVLIDRILKLQRIVVKKQEKIDFLHDHGGQLVDELQKKCRIIQSFALHQEAGSMSSAKSDRNKAEVVKHGGVMASLYTSKPSDDGLTLELSLEINSKLQAVLEDILLKNITLKESVDTLGEEISRLNEVNKQLAAKIEDLSKRNR